MQNIIIFLALLTNVYFVNSQNIDRRALLIAVTQYDRQISNPDCRWDDLSTAEDIKLIKEALIKSGFDSSQIIVVSGKTKKDDIVQAFRKNLIDQAQKNGIYYFHFSGHGYQIPDDNNDEMDGFDEALVPADACNDGGKRKPGFDYSKYLRDDEIQVLLNELRIKAGKQGNVTVSLDACHSGTATRGSGMFRGQVREPDPDAPSVSGVSNTDFGLVVEDKNLSPLTCFFASSEFELNKEYNSSNISCGSLSYALSKALAESNSSTTYAALFDRVKNIMNSIVPGQTPHIEGEFNQEVFGGTIQGKAQYLKIQKVESSKIIQLDGGILASVTENSIVGFYPADTRDLSKATPLIKGKVISSEITKSTVQLDSEYKDMDKLKLSWVYILEKGISNKGISIQVLSENQQIENSFKKKLESYPAYKLTSDNNQTDVLVQLGVFKEKKSDSIYVSNREGLICSKTAISYINKLTENEFDTIIKCIISYEQVKLVRGLELNNPYLNVDLKIIPYKLKDGVPLSKKQKSREDFIQLDSTYIYKNRSSIPEIPSNYWFGLELKNLSVRKYPNESSGLFFSIAAITEKGEINFLLPQKNKNASDYSLGVENKNPLSPIISFGSEPEGIVMLKVFLSKTPLDLRTVFTAKGVGTRGSSSPIENLLNSSFRASENTRGPQQEALETDDIGVKTFMFKIVGKVL